MGNILTIVSLLFLPLILWYLANKSPQLLWASIQNAISWSLGRYLLRRFPVTSISPSGPKSIPTCPYIWPDGQGDVAKFLEGEQKSNDWAEGFGKVYRIWSGMTPEIVLTTPEDVKTVFKDSGLHSKAINNDAGWLMGEILGKCLGLISGNDWRKVHITVAAAFSPSSCSSTSTLSNMTRLINEYFSVLSENTKLNSGLLNPAKDLRLLPFWITAEYLYGKLDTDLRNRLQNMIPLADSIFSRVIQGGITRHSISRYFPTKTNRSLKSFQAQWSSFNDHLYAKCVVDNPDAPIVHIYKAIETGLITRNQGLQTLHEILFANLDVTIGGLAWNLLFLAANPHVQADLREEIRDTQFMPLGRHRGREEYLRNPRSLLAASILESARLKPAAAFSIPQSAPTDRIVGGFLVPANTNFVVDTHAINIRNSYWGDDKTQYRPSRFTQRKLWDMRYNYWRFGFGPRQCLGKHLADLMIRSVIVHLIEHYHLSLVPTSTWNRRPETWILEPDTEIRCESLV